MSGSASKGTPCRRFTLLDGMILVGGLAVGFAWVRSRFPEYSDALGGDPASARWMYVAFSGAGLLLLLSSLVILSFRMRQPRPSIRRVARQPGSVACFTALALAIGKAYSELSFLIANWSEADGPVLDHWPLPFFNPGHETSFAIAAVWIIFALGRIGRPEAGWIDRAGRFVGWSWIAWGVGGQFLSYYFE